MGTASVAEEITQKAQLPWVAGVLALLSLRCSAPSGSLLWPSVLDLSVRVLVDRVIASSQEPGQAPIGGGPHSQSLVLSLCTMAGTGHGTGLPLMGTKSTKGSFFVVSELEKELSLKAFLDVIINP